MEMTVGGHKYRTGKLDAFAQLHVSRKIAPAVASLGQGFSSLKDAMEGGKEPDELAMLGAFKPLLEVVSQMKEEDVNYVLIKCLTTCDREVTEGKWQKVMVNGKFMFEEMTMTDFMPLVISVVKENLGNFTDAVQAVSG